MERQKNALGQLLGSYFHQDWPDEFGSDFEALQAIVEFETADQLRDGVKEIDLLLNESYSEVELRDILINEIGCYFEPESQGISYVNWLTRVRDAFLASITT